MPLYPDTEPTPQHFRLGSVGFGSVWVCVIVYKAYTLVIFEALSVSAIVAVECNTRFEVVEAGAVLRYSCRYV